jgi:hypothetical protein
MPEWKETFDQSKPLITYALISGLNITTIARIFNQIRQGNDPSEMHIEQTVLDRIPRVDRHDYEFPHTAPIFLEGYNIMKENQSPKAIPIVLTGTDSRKRYGVALMFYEDLRDLVRVMQEVIPMYSKEFEDEDIEEEKKENIDMDDNKMPNGEGQRNGTITENERESISTNPFMQIHRYIESFTEIDLTKDAIFKGSNYYLPKAIYLISEYPIFETLEQIVRHIYRECVTGTDFPLEIYLSYLTHYAPLPPIGSEIVYSFPNLQDFKIENKLLNELPYVPTSFYSEFFTKSMLNMNNVYELMYFFMCQLGTTVFISSSANKIVMSTEVLRTIIFPFEYDETYIPCLPTALINYLEAPFPVLVGTVITDKEQMAEVYDIASNKTLFVFLDEDNLQIKINGEILSMKEYHKSYEVNDSGSKTFYSHKVLPMKSK